MATMTLSDAIAECDDAALATRLALILARSGRPLYSDPAVARAAVAADAALKALSTAMRESPSPAFHPSARTRRQSEEELRRLAVAAIKTAERSHLRLIPGGLK